MGIDMEQSFILKITINYKKEQFNIALFIF